MHSPRRACAANRSSRHRAGRAVGGPCYPDGRWPKLTSNPPISSAAPTSRRCAAAARLRKRVLAETASDLNVTVFDAAPSPPAPVVEAANTAVVRARHATDHGRQRRHVEGHRPEVIARVPRRPGARYVPRAGRRHVGQDRQALQGGRHASARCCATTCPRNGSWRLGRRHWPSSAAQAGPAAGAAPRRSGRRRSRPRRARAREAGRLRRTAPRSPRPTSTPSARRRSRRASGSSPTPSAAARRPRRFACSRALYANGEDANGALYALLRHVRNLAAVVELMPESPPAEIAKQLGVHTFTAQKLAEQRAELRPPLARARLRRARRRRGRHARQVHAGARARARHRPSRARDGAGAHRRASPTSGDCARGRRYACPRSCPRATMHRSHEHRITAKESRAQHQAAEEAHAALPSARPCATAR